MNQLRFGRRYRFPQLRVQLHHLLVLRTADVCRVSVRRSARHVAQLAVERSSGSRSWDLKETTPNTIHQHTQCPIERTYQWHSGADGCLLLLVFLSVQVILVRLRARARYFAHIAVVQLLRATASPPLVEVTSLLASFTRQWHPLHWRSLGA